MRTPPSGACSGAVFSVLQHRIVLGNILGGYRRPNKCACGLQPSLEDDDPGSLLGPWERRVIAKYGADSQKPQVGPDTTLCGKLACLVSMLGYGQRYICWLDSCCSWLDCCCILSCRRQHLPEVDLASWCCPIIVAICAFPQGRCITMLQREWRPRVHCPSLGPAMKSSPARKVYRYATAVCLRQMLLLTAE
jgi:hypothetical protein